MKIGIVSFFLGIAAMGASFWFHNDAATAYKYLVAHEGAEMAARMFSVSVEAKVVAASPGLLGIALGGIGLQRKEKWSKAGLVFSTAAILLAILPTWKFFL